MKLIATVLEKTEFFDMKNFYYMWAWLINGSIFLWFKSFFIATLSVPEIVANWSVAISSFLLALMGLRKVIRYFIRDWFPDSKFMNDK